MIQFLDQQLVVSGQIDFDNAQAMCEQGHQLIAQQSTFPLVVNLSQLKNGNTLALAVLIQWLRSTPQAQGLHFQDVPAKMLKIIQASHLEDDLVLI